MILSQVIGDTSQTGTNTCSQTQMWLSVNGSAEQTLTKTKKSTMELTQVFKDVVLCVQM